MAAGMLIQILMGHPDFEFGLYAQILFGLQLPDYLLFALLALVVHALVNQKYLGHLVIVIAYVFMAFAPALGVGNNLLVYGSDPGWTYSDMRGFEPFIGPWLWFKFYWAGWARLPAVAATLLWVTGKEADLRSRLAVARRRFTPPVAVLAAAAGTFDRGAICQSWGVRKRGRPGRQRSASPAITARRRCGPHRPSRSGNHRREVGRTAIASQRRNDILLLSCEPTPASQE